MNNTNYLPIKMRVKRFKDYSANQYLKSYTFDIDAYNIPEDIQHGMTDLIDWIGIQSKRGYAVRVIAHTHDGDES
jgi:hypothetical protein